MSPQKISIWQDGQKLYMIFCGKEAWWERGIGTTRSQSSKEKNHQLCSGKVGLLPFPCVCARVCECTRTCLSLS